MSEDVTFSKRGQRKVSSFIGQELLYDYMTGNLDPERKKAVEEYIQQNKEVQGDIQKIQHGMNYLESLERTRVSEALLEKIKQPTSYLENVMIKMKFDDWSPGFKLGVEASVVAIGVVLVAVFLPWQKMLDFKMGNSDIVLSEITKKFEAKTPAENEVVAKEDSGEKSDLSFPDEVSEAHVAVSSTTSITLKSMPAAAPAVAVVAASTTTSTTLPAADTASTKTAAIAPAAPTDTKRVGYLYRGIIEITNAKAASVKLVEKVSSLGGRKAGEVELGWSKGSGAYFHFTMPENSYEQMTAAFKEYGQLKITKERHERVMPEGIVRVIITVDEKK